MDSTTSAPRKRRFGDRYDGYRVKNLDLPFYLIPNIMRSRVDSQIFFDQQVNIDPLERYLRRKRNEGMTNLRLIHIILAATVRVFALRPRINRFVAGKKIYAHNNLRFSMTIKRSMSDNGEETNILPLFEKTDTLFDVVEKFEKALAESKNKEQNGENKTDQMERLLGHIPTSFKTIVVFTMRNLDKIGFMPKAVYRASPFHSSAFITDVGSFGIDPIYHHLYEFGTTSCFIAVGRRQTVPYLRKDGTLGERRILNLRFVLDERICDGFYYGGSIKLFYRLLKNPESLEIPPTEIPDDL